MNKFINTILLCSIILLPQCNKKYQQTKTIVTNTTSSTIKFSINNTHVFLTPNETQEVDAPLGKVLLSAQTQTKYGYKKTGINNQERKLRSNRKITIMGDDPKYFDTSIKSAL